MNIREKVKISKYGNKNSTGMKDGGAFIFSPYEDDFYYCIEDGILPLVKAFIKLDIMTFGSCEGHVYDDREDNANIVIFITESSDKWIQEIVKSYNSENVVLADRLYRRIPFFGDSVRILFMISPTEREKLNMEIRKFAEYVVANTTKEQTAKFKQEFAEYQVSHLTEK